METASNSGNPFKETSEGFVDGTIDHAREGTIAGAINNLAEAYRERTALMFPQNIGVPESEYHCPKCGSPNWSPGGMGNAFKFCMDCRDIGDPINAE